MIEKIKSGLKKRKAKLFLVFLLCSFFAWFVSNLSETYISNATFDLNFIGIPENKMLMNASKEKLEVRLEAVGFQFLRFNFNNKNVDIDLSKAQQKRGRYFIVSSQYKMQIEKQLSSTMSLVEITKDTLFFDFQEVVSKEIPVKPSVEMNFEQNYLLDGPLKVAPDMIRITGPVHEIEGVLELETAKIEFGDLSSDFSKTVSVIIPDSLFNSKFSTDKVTISGKVSKFSEKIVEVPIQILNLPENMSIRTFPNEIKVVCKAKVSDLKKIKGSDFIVSVDYREVDGNDSSRLSLYLKKVPEHAFGASLVQKQVEYILKNK